MVDRSVWRPDLAAVAAYLRPFTRDGLGVELGTFTPTTPITASEVLAAVDGIVADIAGTVGDVPAALADQATMVASVGAASEAVIDLDQALAEALWARYTDRLNRLKAVVAVTPPDPGEVGPPTEGPATEGPVLGEFPDRIFATGSWW